MTGFVLQILISVKFLISKICNVFKEVSSAQQACVYLIQNTAKRYNFEIFVLFKITVFYILKCKNAKLNLLQSHDPSEINLIF